MNNKVTLEGIQAKIKSEVYLVLPDGKSTLCILTLENGYTIKGISACVDAANFDMNIGRKIAYEDAIRQIWPLEGYLLAQRLHDQVQTNKDPVVVAVKAAQDRVNKPLMSPTKDPAAWGFKKDGTPKRKPGGPRK